MKTSPSGNKVWIQDRFKKNFYHSTHNQYSESVFFCFFFYFFFLYICSCIQIKFTMVVFKQHLNNNKQYEKIIFTDHLIYKKLYYSIRSIDPNV